MNDLVDSGVLPAEEFPLSPTALPHPEEMNARLVWRIADNNVIDLHARATPAGTFFTGLGIAAVLWSLGYLVRSRR